jgi:IS30 family transposase
VTAHLTIEQRALARRLRSKGWRLKDIAKEIGCSYSGVHLMLHGEQPRAAKPVRWTPRVGRLTLVEREEIRFGLARGESMSAIARGLGRAPSSVTREVKANGGVERYRVWPAYLRAELETRRPKVTKLSLHPKLCAKVTKGLESLWSPEEISARLRREFPGDPTMQVSPETIYQSLYVQGRGELRRELARCLRSGRTTRKPLGGRDRSGRVRDMVMITDRPAEVADRAVPGHWEGDLIIGKDSRSAVGTLVERSTRFVLLLHLPNGYGAVEVESAMRKAITTLPKELVRSITWDQGTEMARHVDFTVKTGVPVYFCDPHSPWQRGSNENTNGLLRQYMPKGTDLTQHSAADLRKIQRSLNGRPRKTLDYMMPMEKLAEFIALTA